MDLHSLGTILAINLVGIFTPGPDVFLILRLATKSRRQALSAVSGIACGVAVWVSLTVFGAAALLSTFPQIMGAVQLVGGLWLGYMAFGMAQSARAQWGLSSDELGVVEKETNERSMFRTGLFTNLSNPKVVLYFAAILAPLMPAHAPWWTSIVLIVVIVAEAALCQGFVAMTVSTEKVKRRLLGAGAYIDGGAAIIFGLFGCALVFKGVASFF